MRYLGVKWSVLTSMILWSASAVYSSPKHQKMGCNSHDFVQESIQRTVRRQDVIVVGRLKETNPDQVVPLKKGMYVGTSDIEVLHVLKGEWSGDVMHLPHYFLDQNLWQKTREIYFNIDLKTVFEGDSSIGNVPYKQLVYEGHCGSVPLMIPGEYYLIMPSKFYAPSSIVLLNAADDPVLEIVKLQIQAASTEQK